MSTTLVTHKQTPTEHDILDVIKNRWSPRSFSEESVDQETLNRLFEAVRWAPSAMNEQPWRFIVSKLGESGHEQMIESLMPGNQPWAKHAPVLITTLVKKTIPNHEKKLGRQKKL